MTVGASECGSRDDATGLRRTRRLQRRRRRALDCAVLVVVLLLLAVGSADAARVFSPQKPISRPKGVGRDPKGAGGPEPTSAPAKPATRTSAPHVQPPALSTSKGPSDAEIRVVQALESACARTMTGRTSETPPGMEVLASRSGWGSCVEAAMYLMNGRGPGHAGEQRRRAHQLVEAACRRAAHPQACAYLARIRERERLRELREMVGGDSVSLPKSRPLLSTSRPSAPTASGSDSFAGGAFADEWAMADVGGDGDVYLDGECDLSREEKRYLGAYLVRTQQQSELRARQASGERVVEADEDAAADVARSHYRACRLGNPTACATLHRQCGEGLPDDPLTEASCAGLRKHLGLPDAYVRSKAQREREGGYNLFHRKPYDPFAKGPTKLTDADKERALLNRRRRRGEEL